MKTSLVAFFFALLLCSNLLAQIPQKISYQGKLQLNGSSVNGTKLFSFNIGSWSEQQTVTVTNGLYSVTLGAVNPIPTSLFVNNKLSLKVKVDNSYLSPNVELISVPYAFYAQSANETDPVWSADKTNYALKTDINWTNISSKPKLDNSVWVDITNDQSIGGNKTFNNVVNFSGGLKYKGLEAYYFDSNVNLQLGYRTNAVSPTGLMNCIVGGGNYNNISGSYNALLGASSGRSISTGNRNTFVGTRAGFTNNSSDNVFIGEQSGYFNSAGSNNVFVGQQSGYNSTGTGNVFIGFQAGYNETTVSNRLYINNGPGYYPLIWGDFTNDRVVINGDLVNNVNNRTFFVTGSAGGTTAWWNDSDVKLKKNIQTIDNSLTKILNLRGVYYEWKDTAHYATGRQIGFIAQEAVKIIPEVVTTGDIYSMQYAPITALLVEAIKELNTKNELLKSENDALRKNQDEFRTELNEIKKLMNMNPSTGLK